MNCHFKITALLTLVLAAGSAAAQYSDTGLPLDPKNPPKNGFDPNNRTGLTAGMFDSSRPAISNFTVPPPVFRTWMSTEVQDAWNQGYMGQGVTITVVDQFSGRSTFNGKLESSTERLLHGQWTSKQAGLVAPMATMNNVDFTSNSSPVSLSSGLNVMNLSYGMIGRAGFRNVYLGEQANSLINYASTGSAVVVKAAGNDSGRAVNTPNANFGLDYLSVALLGKPSAIYVGALSTNGTVDRPARMASYSSIAGLNPTAQKQFLVVGVDSAKTGLNGTSFAAPIVSGYSAILGSKFEAATPVQITQQLLNTARKDTVAGYNPAIHGRGEASLTRALAPVSIR